MHKLEQLWYLQQCDSEITKLEKQYKNEPLVSEVKELKAKLKKEEERLKVREDDLREKKKKYKMLELELQKATDEIKYLKKQLYGGEVSNLKELSNMEKKLELVEKDEVSLENNIIDQIELMEESEQLSEEQKKRCKVIQNKLDKKTKEMEKALNEINKSIEGYREKRKGLEEKVSKEHLARYNRLIQRPDKKGVARVINNRCEGCRVSIPNSQAGKLYNPDIILYCENCGRLLVKFRIDHENELAEKREKES